MKTWKQICITLVALILSAAVLFGMVYLYESNDIKEMKSQLDEIQASYDDLKEDRDNLLDKLEAEGVYDLESGLIVVNPKSFDEGEATLDGLKITVDGDGDAVVAKGNSIVTINGGKYDGGQTSFGSAGNTAVWVNGADAKVIINDGEFYINGLAVVDDVKDTGHIDMLYVSEGTLEINGGFFKGADADVWLVNCKDAKYTEGTAKVVIKGGTFVNWNPADNCSEGEHTNFLAEGYTVETVTQENGDVWYKVVEVVAEEVTE